ncbi:hypothetical protein [Pseudomonas viridiflava]|uniref:hypothetical protein n=1 Tax=Pseudomonas viridiflava TaxID=33069 RepID=UPI000F031D9D|nr:hypothetical protein [Pseudomonas viridiflava]MDY0918431.1 hypothetical protein [Pseudomonas viridiflava]
MLSNGFTPELREHFLAVLEDTCSPKTAAEACGISRRTAFYHKANNPEFRAKWEKAIEVALDALLDEAYRRGALGVEEPVIHAGKVASYVDSVTGEQKPLTVRKHSDRLLEVLLKFRYGEQMASRIRVKVEASTGLNMEALQRMAPDDQAQLAVLLERYATTEQSILAETEE